MDAFLAEICEVAREAGQHAMERRRNSEFQISQKGPQDFVTEVDRDVEHMICAKLAQIMPDTEFIGEESQSIADPASASGEKFWVVDPIDGTAGFLWGLPDWAVSIALVSGNQIEAGVVYAPMHDEMYAASRASGAFLNGDRIPFRPDSNLSFGFTSVSGPVTLDADHYCAQIRRLRQLGGELYLTNSAALTLGQTAAGRLVGCIENNVRSWDVFAGMIIAEMAGLVVKDNRDVRDFYAIRQVVAAPASSIEELESVAAAS